MQRYLVLANGKVFPGTAFGSSKSISGEVVFTTGMTGYQEAITDASYKAQILTFTYPLIGNYGVNLEDNESGAAKPSAIVCHEIARRPSNWRSAMSLADWATQQDLPGITDVDTRQLTREIREAGVMQAMLVDELTPNVFTQAAALTGVTDQVAQVTNQILPAQIPVPADAPRVAVLDFGLKDSILRALQERGLNTLVFPATTDAATILANDVQGVMLSNGPGNPESLPDVLPVIRELEDNLPLMAICLGHQLFALANGAATFKMKYGHRGFNHAVRDLQHHTIGFTSQNHGYAVNRDSLTNTALTVTHEEINDHTVEGLQLAGHNAFSVQFHPDAAPGPHDYVALFDQFKANIVSFQKEAQHA